MAKTEHKATESNDTSTNPATTHPATTNHTTKSVDSISHKTESMPTKPELSTDDKARLAELAEQLGVILKEHGGESNIGLSHNYWKLLAEYRSLSQNK
jgi:hypothetical protein